MSGENTMKNLYILISLVLFLASCNKEDQLKFIYEHNTTDKYVINLSNGIITDYSRYSNDIFVEKTTISDYDSVVVKLTTNSQGILTDKIVYTIGNNTGLASSSVDSGFTAKGLYVQNTVYEYSGVYLNKTTTTSSQSWESTVPGEYYQAYTIENENIKSKNISFPDFKSGCTNIYEYNKELNKIDIRAFSNGITGKINRNLVKHASWSTGCAGGPSSSTAYTDYSYEIDWDGYITRMSETYTPIYHLTEPGTVTRTVSTTLYEYHGRDK
jgi:hypothetical protein